MAIARARTAFEAPASASTLSTTLCTDSIGMQFIDGFLGLGGTIAGRGKREPQKGWREGKLLRRLLAYAYPRKNVGVPRILTERIVARVEMQIDQPRRPRL